MPSAGALIVGVILGVSVVCAARWCWLLWMSRGL